MRSVKGRFAIVCFAVLTPACASTSDREQCTSGSTACDVSSGATPNSPGTTALPWTLGTWYAPAYDDNSTSKHIPPKSIGIEADGTYVHTAGGVIDDRGTWKITGDTIVLGAYGSLVRSRNCGFLNYDDGNRTDTYYRDDAATSCPDAIAPLTAVEKCLVGTFTETRNQNLATAKFTWKRSQARTQLFEQIYVGNGDAAMTAVYYWSVAGGQLCTEGVDRASGCERIDWPLVRSTRTSPKDPGCVEP